MEKVIIITDNKAIRNSRTRRILIRKAALKAARTCMHNAFNMTQDIVPVFGKVSKISVANRDQEPGALKRSGSYSETDDGAVIRYSAPYSSFVERGVKAGNYPVKGHHTKTGKWVEPYTRHMKKGIEPRRFIERSMNTCFEPLFEEFDNNLKRSK